MHLLTKKKKLPVVSHMQPHKQKKEKYREKAIAQFRVTHKFEKDKYRKMTVAKFRVTHKFGIYQNASNRTN